MSSPIAPENQRPDLRASFRFDLRTMLVLTALLAWLFAWSGGWGISTCVALAGLALIEAGCFRGMNVLQLLVRNLAAFLVCSLVFAAVGLGLMYGENPTGWFGTDHFLTSPFTEEADAGEADQAGPSSFHDDVKSWPEALVVLVVVAHRVLAGRGRWPAYLLLWLAMAGIILPVFGSWNAPDFYGSAPAGGGWLTRIGFQKWHPYPDFHLIAGLVALAGTLVLAPRRGRSGHRLSLLAPSCSHLLVAMGAALLLFLWGLIDPIVEVFVWLGEDLSTWRLCYICAFLVPSAMGLIGAAIASPLILRRFHWPLVLCGGLAGWVVASGMSWLENDLRIFLPVIASLGLVAGGLVVLSSWLLDRLGLDDPGGAVAVHGVAAVWGLFATGLLAVGRFFGYYASLVDPVLEVIVLIACIVWTLPLAVGLFLLIKFTPGFAVAKDRAKE